MGFVTTSCSTILTLGAVTGGWPFTLLIKEWLFYQLPAGCRRTSSFISRKVRKFWDWETTAACQVISYVHEYVEAAPCGSPPQPTRDECWDAGSALSCAFWTLHCLQLFWQVPLKTHQRKERNFPRFSGSSLLYVDQGWLLVTWLG